MKLSVVYDSKTGNTKQAAQWIIEGMESVAGVEAKAFSIESVDEEFVIESKGIVIGSPSYAASMTPALHEWFSPPFKKPDFAGKLGGAFATEQYTHGGGTLVIQSILNTEMVAGMLCYSGGVMCGEPFIHLGPVGVNDNIEKHNRLELYKENFVIYGGRFAKKAMELWG